MNIKQWIQWFSPWIWRVIFLINLTWDCSSRIVSGSEIFNFECTTDSHCPLRQFCNFPTKSCVNCTQCRKFKMMQGMGNCARGKNECGPCEPGYTLNEDHCSFNTNTRKTDDTRKLGSNIVDQETSNEITSFVIFVLGSATPIFLFCAYVGIRYYKKKFRSVAQPPRETDFALTLMTSETNDSGRGTSSSADKMQTIISVIPDEYGPPPPYNENFSVSEIFIERRIINENVRLLRAVPDDFGNFPSPSLQSLHIGGDAVVPNHTETDSIEPVPTQHNSMVLDGEMLATVVDLRQWATEESSPSSPSDNIEQIEHVRLNNTENMMEPTQSVSDCEQTTSTPTEFDMDTDDTLATNQSLLPGGDEEFMDLSNSHQNLHVDTPDPPEPSRNNSANSNQSNESGSWDNFLVRVDFSILEVFHNNGLARQSQDSLSRHQFLESTYFDLSLLPEEFDPPNENFMDYGIEEPNVSRVVPEEELNVAEGNEQPLYHGE